MCIMVALLPSTDALHGAGYPHGDDRRGVIPGVLEAALERRHELRQLGDLLAIAIGRFRQLGEVWRGLKGAALIVRRRDAVALGVGVAQARSASAVGAVHKHHRHVRSLWWPAAQRAGKG